MWIAYASLAAVFSALVAILTKLGVSGVNSHFATAVRTTGVMVVTWLFVWGMRVKGSEMQLGKKQLLYLVLSALATGGAWLAYNRALQLGPATRVASVDKMSVVLVAVFSWFIFKENMSPMAIVSILLITVGTVMLVFS